MTDRARTHYVGDDCLGGHQPERDHDVTFALDPADPATLSAFCGCGWRSDRSGPLAAKQVADEVAEHLRGDAPDRP